MRYVALIGAVVLASMAIDKWVERTKNLPEEFQLQGYLFSRNPDGTYDFYDPSYTPKEA